MKGRREGLSAVELLVALVLLAAVVSGAWRVFASQRRAAEELRVRTEILEAERAVRVILSAELAAGVPGRDWRLPEPGVVELRAFRGWALRCSGADTSGDRVVVAYRGVRLADSTKDSVLVLDRDGGWTATALQRREVLPAGCPGTEGMPAAGARLEEWELDPAVPAAVLLKVFERGSYHLTDGSLRYRRGAGGRQPLTPPVLDARVSGFVSRDGGATVVLTVAGAGGRGGAWGRTLRGNTAWPP